MTLRDYIARVPWQDGRLPLVPAMQTAQTSRWLIPLTLDDDDRTPAQRRLPERWYWYCDATRLDIFPVPDSLDARCCGHHLALYDPERPTPPGPAPHDTPWLRERRAKRLAQLYALHERRFEERLAHWLAARDFTIADDID